jgi:hypothetical protein
MPAPTAAHRLDEYLQATRVAIAQDRVDLEIDLTPGVAVSRQVFGWIDTNRDGKISAAEGDAYAALVLAAIALDVDHRKLSLTLVDRKFPTLAEMTAGIGTIRLTVMSRLPHASAGLHRLIYRNAHRPAISVYLVNALVPVSREIEITHQRRDTKQHELWLDYRVGDGAGLPPDRIHPAVAVADDDPAIGNRW